jgi:hypothetical protein
VLIKDLHSNIGHGTDFLSDNTEIVSVPRGEFLNSIVTDLINALPSNGSVNTVQHAAIDEVVFSVSSAPSSDGTAGLCNPFRSNGSVNTLRVGGDVTQQWIATT